MPYDIKFTVRLNGDLGQVRQTTPRERMIIAQRSRAGRLRTKQAQKRAKELLRRHLTDIQREQMDKNHWFDLRSSGGARYRIHCLTYSENIQRLGRRTRYYCIHLQTFMQWFPLDDHLLAQKLLIESDEDAFLSVARRIA